MAHYSEPTGTASPNQRNLGRFDLVFVRFSMPTKSRVLTRLANENPPRVSRYRHVVVHLNWELIIIHGDNTRKF